MQRSTRIAEQGSHACCTGRSSSETVVRCCGFSGALEPNKRVERTVTRWFLTSRRQDQFCAELSIHGAARASSAVQQHRGRSSQRWLLSWLGMHSRDAPHAQYMLLHGYIATWLHGYIATWLHGYSAAWLQRCTATVLQHGQSVCRSHRHRSFNPVNCIVVVDNYRKSQ